MMTKFGEKHFNFLPECLIVPQDRALLAQKITEDPESWWIVKPPGTASTRYPA